MRAPAGGVVGIRLRLASGRKLSVRGGHERLFVPSELTGSGPLLIAEGPTDTAALLDLGFDAIGRPNCSGGTRHVVDYLQLNGVHDVVVVADGDEPGRIGAEKLARILTAYVEDVRVIAPPAGIKDARQWKRMGATHDVITATIGNARWRPLVVSIRRRGSDA
jgi:5S rRNA maturation endonuclease (ribonuclease M5)